MLIRTKLIPPSLPEDHVPRPRLWADLGPDPERCLTLVVAPAGFGKTTLVTSWLAASGIENTCWLTLDPLDSRSRQFTQYLVASLKSALPEAFRRSDRALDEPGLSGTVIEQTLCSDLSGVDEPLALVLDDYQALDRGAPHGLIERIVESCSSDVHMVILSREEPRLPTARWRARGRLREIGLEDLAFDAEEARHFLSSPGAAEKDVPMGGWAAGLRLAKLSGGATNRLPHAVGIPPGVRELIREEILDPLPEDVRSTLAVALPFPRFREGLLAHVLEGTGRTDLDARESIRALERQQLFITRLEDEGTWYGFHDVFREVALQCAIQHVGPEAVREFIHRGAGWFQREGHVEEAIRLLVGIGDLDRAAEFVGEGLEDTLLQDPTRRQLMRWLDLFPDGADEGRLPLLVAKASLAVRKYDVGTMGSMLRRIDDLGPDALDAADPALRAVIGFCKVLVDYLTGDPETALTEAEKVLHGDDVAIGGWTWTGTVLYQAHSLSALGRQEEARSVLAAAEGNRSGIGGWAQGALITTRMGMELSAGDLGQAKVHAHRMLSMPAGVSIPDYWVGCAHYVLGVVALEAEDLQGADGHFASVIPFRHTMPTRVYHEALVGRSLVALALGDRDGARSWADEAFAYAQEVNDPGSEAAALSLRRRIEGPEMVLAGTMPPPDRGLVGWWLEFPVLTYARALVAAPDAATVDSGEYLASAHQAAEGVRNRRVSVALALLLAATLHRKGRESEAETLLRRTLEGVEERTVRRTILESGPAVHTLMEQCGFSVPAPRHTDASDKMDRSGGVQVPAPRAKLTPRQKEVLGCLFRRLTNAEIAEELFISPETVKSHVAALCRKLGAANRREAVQIARDLRSAT